MASEVTKHTVTLAFEIELERDDDEEGDKRYRVSCDKPTGCQMYASIQHGPVLTQSTDGWS